jgi:2-oxo-3-hexenedioate decarboxylase
LDTAKIKELSSNLHEARVSGQPISQISGSLKDWTIDDAYSIQELGIEKRVESGEKLIGLKMGLTSEAKRKQMNLHSPLYGELTDKMEVKNGGEFSLTGSIHPKIEPEIAFMIDKDLEGDVTTKEVLAAVSGVCIALEILDSRYDQFKYFSMEDVVSDNSSSSHYIIGDMKGDFKDLDLDNLSMKMSVTEDLFEEGNSSAISGDPLVSVVQLCELLKKRKRKLPAGSLVLAGAATTAIALEKGMNIELSVEGFEKISVSVVE